MIEFLGLVLALGLGILAGCPVIFGILGWLYEGHRKRRP